MWSSEAFPIDPYARLALELRRLDQIEGGKEALVSTRAIAQVAREIVDRAALVGEVNPDPQVAAWAAFTLRVLRERVHEAQQEWVTVARASTLSKWCEPTLRKFAEMAVSGENAPDPWGTLVARRESPGARYSLLLSSIPRHPSLQLAGVEPAGKARR